MKKIFFLFVILYSCNSGTNNKPSNVDSVNGMSEEQFREHFIDSARKAMDQEIAFRDTGNLETSPIKVLSARPVQKEYSNYKDIRLSWKNISAKTISAIRFKWYGINAFNEPADMGGLTEGLGGGFSDDKLRPGKTDYGTWNILSRDLKKVTKAWAYEVVFEDGTKWEAKTDNY